MKKNNLQFKIFFTLIIFLGLFGMAKSSRADTHNAVDSNGNPSCTQADVTTAYNASADGDIVAIPAGSCTWTSALMITKAITLQGAGTSSTIITHNAASGVPLIDLNLPIGKFDQPIRVTGIYFENTTFCPSCGSNKTTLDIFIGDGNSNTKMTAARIDHCTFHNGKKAVGNIGWSYGVIDHNTFNDVDLGIGLDGDNNSAWSRPIEMGTANAMFIEDNIFATGNLSGCGNLNEQIYHNSEGIRSVTRHNTFTSSCTEEYWPFEAHGNGNYYTGTGGDMRGSPTIEVYENTFSAYKITGPAMYFRGGSIIAYNNTITTTIGTAGIQLSEEEGWSSIFPYHISTWPAQDQINNSFFWGNTVNGQTASVFLNMPSDSIFIQEGRDYFLHAPQAIGGKETYTGRAGGDMTFSGSGVNAYYPYTAYAYPHPLTLFADTTPPAAPSGLSVL